MENSNVANVLENEEVKAAINNSQFVAEDLFTPSQIAEEQGKHWEEMLRSDDFIRSVLTFTLRFDIDIGDVYCPYSDGSLTITTSMLPPLFNFEQALENFKRIFAAETKVDKIDVSGMRCNETGYVFFVLDEKDKIFNALLKDRAAYQDTNGFHITVRTPLYCLQTNELISEEAKLRLHLSSLDWQKIL